MHSINCFQKLLKTINNKIIVKTKILHHYIQKITILCTKIYAKLKENADMIICV